MREVLATWLFYSLLKTSPSLKARRNKKRLKALMEGIIAQKTGSDT